MEENGRDGARPGSIDWRRAATMLLDLRPSDRLDTLPLDVCAAAASGHARSPGLHACASQGKV